MITHTKAVPAFAIALALLVGPLVLAQVQLIPADRRVDLLVKTRSIEQPQLSQYAVPLPAGNRLTMLPVAGNVYMVAGAPGNIAVQAGEDGVVLVNTGRADVSEWVLQAVQAVSTRQINIAVMTNPNPDHFGGNANIAATGRNPTQGQQQLGGPVRNTNQDFDAGLPAGGGGRGGLQAPGAIIFGHENALNFMSAPTGQASAYPFEFWPTSTFFTPKKTYYWNGEAIEMISEVGATTDGDIMVFFRRSDVIAAGDVINALGYPRIDVERGGSIQAELEALNDIVELTVPSYNQQGGTKVIPGYGRIYQEHDVVMYRDMMTIIRDRVQLGIEKGMTLAQIQAQRPTLDYDGLYSTPEYTGEMLVETIYRNLTAASNRTAAAR
ncbi:MAG: hypothetical protein HY657_13735 [Acidobacteria bacterium]|nr:hypothetical protein [Acidobacteriota bacterium]